MTCELVDLELLAGGRVRRRCPRCLWETVSAPGLPIHRRCGPPSATKARHALAAARKIVAAAAAGERVRVDAAEQGRRWAICQTCEHWLPDRESCALCGCIGQFKVRLATEQCPADPPKW